MSELLDCALAALDGAKRAGSTGAECTVVEGEEFSVAVRMGEVETLKQAGSRSAGLRILRGRRTGSAYTSDLTREGIRKLVESAMELAAVTTEDPMAGLPDAKELGALDGDLELEAPLDEELDPAMKIERAKLAEAAARGLDPRIKNSDGASFDSYRGRHVFANSLGFAGEYGGSYCSLSCVPVAVENGKMERDYWHAIGRSARDLEAPEQIGETAARRALRRLGAVKVPTQRVPVIFEPRVARSLIGNLFEAVDGRSIYRGASFLRDRVGEAIANAAVTLVDDATAPRRFGSRPFDDEGVRTRRTAVIERGILKSWLLNSYAARKLGLETTGNAARGITGNAGIGHGAFYFEPGERSPEEIIGAVNKGLFVTELIGSGVNTVTGDYSRGAAGVWIENGELAFSVSEVTIAGTLQQMLMSLEVASDLEFRGSIASPTLFVGEMTVGGR